MRFCMFSNKLFFGMQTRYRHAESADVQKLRDVQMKNFMPVFRPLSLHEYGKCNLFILLKPRCQFCSKPLVITLGNMKFENASVALQGYCQTA